MPLDEENPEVMVAVFGRQVNEFMLSDIGRYIVQCAEMDESDALQDLAKVDPHNPVKVSELQNKVWRARSVVNWLREAVQKGIEAVQVLEGE
jgi:hypothetical protein